MRTSGRPKSAYLYKNSGRLLLEAAAFQEGLQAGVAMGRQNKIGNEPIRYRPRDAELVAPTAQPGTPKPEFELTKK